MATKCQHIQVRCRFTLNGHNVEILRAQTEYRLNSIPRALVSLAVGYDAKTLKDAIVNNQWDALRTRLPAQLFIELNGEERKIFDGYVAGFAPVRTPQSAGISLSLVGWLDDLRATSALSEIFSPSTPGNLLSPASIAMFGKTVLNPVHAGHMVRAYVKGNLWEALQRAMTALSQKALLTGPAAAAATGSNLQQVDTSSNSLGAAALKKIFGTLELIKGDERVEDAISRHIGAIVFGAEGGPTLWSKLMVAQSVFTFALSPRVSSAEVIAYQPFVPSSMIQKVLPAEFESGLEGNEVVQFPTKGVALFGGNGSMFSARDPKQPTPGRGKTWNTLGIFQTNGPGIFEILAAPFWLTSQNYSSVWTKSTTGLSSGGIPGNGPKAKVDSPGKGKSVVDDRNQAQETFTLGDRWAKTRWLQTVYANRYLKVRTPVRFDICPGSNVALEFPSSSQSGVLAKIVYGNVDAVNMTLSAPEARVETTLDVSCVRSKGEDSLADGDHPIFKKAFLNAPLIN